MPLPNSQDTVASQSLAPALLTSVSLAKVDKGHLIQSYIRSQRTYRSYFSQEGHKARLAWDKDGCDGQEEVETGFSTPTLKARVPEPIKDKAKDIQRGRNQKAAVNSSDDEHQPSEVSSTMTPLATQTKSKSKAVPENQQPRKDRNTAIARPRSPNKLDQYLEPTESQSKKTTRKRERSPNSGSERERILADRRERRRAKKAIIEPRRRSEEANNRENSSAARKRDKKDSKSSMTKSKVTNLAAGLALMHGFSATNIGRARLTLKPSYGVFHKGKASAKTSVSKSKRRPLTAAWSELEFLGQISKPTERNPTTNRRSRSLDDVRSGSEDDALSRSSRASCRRPKKKFKICNNGYDESSKKTKAQNPTAEEDNIDQEDVAQVSEDERMEVAAGGLSPHPRAESPVWDIERASYLLDDSRDAVSDTQVSKVTPSNAPTKNDTVILDIGARWNSQNSSYQSTSQKQAPQNVPDDPMRYNNNLNATKSCVSLCPSQSASQRAGPHSTEVIPAPGLTRSKYFGAISALREPDSLVVRADTGDWNLTSDNNLCTAPAPRNVASVLHHVPPLAIAADDSVDSLENEDPTALPVPQDQSPSRHRPVSPVDICGAQFSSPALSYLTLDYEPANDTGALEPALRGRPDPGSVYRQQRDGFTYASRPILDEDEWVEYYSDAMYDPDYDHRAVSRVDIPAEDSYCVYDTVSDFPNVREDAPDYSLDMEQLSSIVVEFGPPPYEDIPQLDSGSSLLGDQVRAFDADMDLRRHPEFLEEDHEIGEDFAWDPAGALDSELLAGAFHDNEEMDGAPPASGDFICREESPSPSSSTAESLANPDTAVTCSRFPSSSAAHLLLRSGVGVESVVGWAPSVGRAMTQQAETMFPTVSKVEEDVAKGLRDHWLPQRL
ncbi:uncharacterized protein PHACADRAFT_170238 [Phanerochaete carnosa HHB-10118-sp]|uniref:Uncharacterized protein n=1 Tax=Phanerochaete carnosa (strain HHB-10118-sp) TaxID=650164 RepID=K5WJR0_PHACS|nr:uncharacterized protein PHACADRAFT_170238 [Phanerochaete carnosa HHB-10118-sp]EKM59650.1 hypothetical protein PHACADRAFT_170238 [Phanerochaete carnosa HHB-10118-sp]